MSITLEQKQKMERLIRKLNEATLAYDQGTSLITDKEWDNMYFELAQLEKETDTVLPGSPVHSIFFETVSELKKVEHNHPMLSLDKTKDIEVINSFIKGKEWIAMAKMDGLTCSLRYIDGKLVSAETRGDGIIGEDITHNAKVIPSIPKTIGYKNELIVDGEIICTYKNFESFKNEYKNPRNFASGSIRLLNSKECASRLLTFVAWDVITSFNTDGAVSKYLNAKLNFIKELNFTIVPFFIEGATSIEDSIEQLKYQAKEVYSYPIDGVVFKYDNIKEYNNAGRTDHHFKGGLAYKFYDETYPTRLSYIHWSMGRTGVLTPVAVFSPVNIDGTEVTRASLHNVSIMKETLGDCAYVGEPLEITKVNQIIPQIVSAGPKYDYGYVISHGGVSANDAPEHCPICNGLVSYKEENGITRLYCDNGYCQGKLINRLDHFCGKKGLDIKGLSKMTLNKLIDWNWIESIEDIFKLDKHKNEWMNKPGFGVVSVSKILKAIEDASNCQTDKFICAIGIPYIGKVASVAIANKFKKYKNFRLAIENKDNDAFLSIDGIGDVMVEEIMLFDYTEADNTFYNFIKEIAVVSQSNDTVLKDKVFVITGKLKSFKNRDEFKSFIESKGGKVTNSVTKNTSYLINNDINSETAKNVTAKKLNIPIITEEDFKTLITEFSA